MKYLSALVVSLGFVAVLLSVYYLHVLFFTVNVVFYSAIYDALIASFLMLILLYYVPYIRAAFSGFERTLIVLVWILGGYAFAISVPTVVDRSLSMYILEKIQQRGGGIKHEAMSKVFIDEYLPEHRLVDVRLTEQLESGTIRIVDNCVILTRKGYFIAKMSRLFRRHLLPKKRLLMGEYSDDLTDPFRNSKFDVDYLCSAQKRL